MDYTLSLHDALPISADVKFTGEYCMDPDGGCAQLEKFDGVTGIATPRSEEHTSELQSHS